MATQTSNKYDNITCKELIQSGSPAVYQLSPKKENVGTLTRMTLGKKVPKKINKTILLVGETGTGKSTLINALLNYAMGVQWEDDVWFQIVEEKETKQSESQTSDVIVYEIFGFEGKTLPYSLTIIDTPGFGDTRGIDRDDIITQRLLDLFSSGEGVHEINAVGLVVKATENRVSDRLSYIFNSVMSPFAKDMENKIVALITHSDGVTPENVLQALKAANIKCAKDEDSEPVHFLFNNRQSVQKTKKNKIALKSAWDVTMDQMGQFTDFLEESSPQSLITTVKVMDKQIRLTACIQNMEEKMKTIELKQTVIQQTQEALKRHEREMKNNEEFTVEINEVYKDKERISGGWYFLGLFFKGAVSCNVCKENCHYPGCTRAWTAEGCEVMKDDCCTVCECSASDHMKEEWIYVDKTRKVKKTVQDVKDKYNKGKAGIEKETSVLESLKKNMYELQMEKDQWLEKAFKHVVRLDEISLNAGSLSTHVHLGYLIEKMEEKGDKEKVKILKEMKSRMDKDESTKGALRYKLAAAGKAVKSMMK